MTLLDSGPVLCSMCCLSPPTRTGFPVFSSRSQFPTRYFSASSVSTFHGTPCYFSRALLVCLEDVGTQKNEGSHVARPLCAHPAQSLSVNILVFTRRVGVGGGASNRCNQNEDKIRIGCEPKTQMEKATERLLSSRF